MHPTWTKPRLVERVALIADEQTAEVAQPGEEVFDTRSGVRR